IAGGALRVALIFSFFLPCSVSRAADSATVTAPPPPRIAPADIDRALKETFERREFAWRMPRDAARPVAEKSKGWLAQFFDGIGDWLKRVFRKIGKWMSDFKEWWRRVTNSKAQPKSVPGGTWTFGALNAVEWVLYLLL